MREGDLLTVRGLATHFFTDEGVVRALEGVDLDVPRGRTLCVVGESGSGKSVTARSILRIVDAPGRIVRGKITFRPEDGAPVDLAALDPRGRAIRAIRGRQIAIVFQEPMTALSPVHTIGEQMTEAARMHMGMGRKAAADHAVAMLARVGLPRPADRMGAYSFELSGGMRQRVCIALALVCRPQLLIADEPTTALDVTTQAGILDLLRDLQVEMGMSVIFITHDLGVVAEIADEVAVMYLGRVVERGNVDRIFYEPKHPYTRALLESVPKLTLGSRGELAAIRGMVPHPFDRPSGCAFHTRCDRAMPNLCDRVEPRARRFGDGHEAACLLYGAAAEPA